MTYEQIQRQLSNVTYTKAIRNYTIMKHEFLEQYSKALKDQTEDKAKQNIQDFINEINTEQFQGKSFAAANVLMDKLEKSMVKALGNTDLSELNTLIQQTEGKYKNLTSKGTRELQRMLNKIYDIDEIHKAVQDALKFLKIRNNQRGLNKEDLLNWSRSYVNQILYYKAANKNTKIDKTVPAGYFEEALVHKATLVLTKDLTNRMGAIQTGSTKIKSVNSKKAVDTIFDEYFNFLAAANLNKIFKESIDVDKRVLMEGFGAQIKLKNLPWRINNPRGKYFPIGQNIELYNLWVNKTSWIKGVQFLHNQVRRAMGDNVMYISGNSFAWTHELIAEAKANDYYLAFYYNEESEHFTQTIRWEPIDPTKSVN